MRKYRVYFIVTDYYTVEVEAKCSLEAQFKAEDMKEEKFVLQDRVSWDFSRLEDLGEIKE